MTIPINSIIVRDTQKYGCWKHEERLFQVKTGSQGDRPLLNSAPFGVLHTVGADRISTMSAHKPRPWPAGQSTAVVLGSIRHRPAKP